MNWFGPPPHVTAASTWPLRQLSVFTFIREQLRPGFITLLGDLTYTDIGHVAGVEIPFRLPWARAWSRLFAVNHFVRLLASVPSWVAFDDHEVENDWAGLAHPLATEGLANFERWAGSRNFGRSLTNEDEDLSRWYTFRYGRALAVFVLDVRTHRSHADEQDGPHKSLLGSRQKRALLAWLLNNTDSDGASYKVIASPGSWSRDGDGTTYGHERAEIFRWIARHAVCGVVILSGDMHTGSAYRYDVVIDGGLHHATVHEFSASPFQALPFPDPNPTPPGHTPALEEQPGITETRLFMSAMRFHFGQVVIDDSAGVEMRISIWGWPMFSQTEPKVLFTTSLPAGCNAKDARVWAASKIEHEGSLAMHEL